MEGNLSASHHVAKGSVAAPPTLEQAPHFSRTTVFHELNPGHHLQGFMMARYNQHRHVFETPFWIEGNALYWGIFLWDHGFQVSPYRRARRPIAARRDRNALPLHRLDRERCEPDTQGSNLPRDRRW